MKMCLSRINSGIAFFLILGALFMFLGCSSSGKESGDTAAAINTAEDNGSLLVQTSYGSVLGKKDNNALSWLGIPFAAPPVGELRWRAPLDPEPWDGVRDATSFKSACTQYGTILYILDQKLYGKPTGCEDCLYLNIWRPNSTRKNLPVFFYIHGGANVIGSASLPVYNGANLSSNTDMIVVAPNYRLGIMGWFTHPSLRLSDKMDNSGNYGTLDLIKALDWVQKNISYFGGDPNNVTLCGQSAGAFNIHSLLASPLADGLFSKAIMQSGFPSSTKVQKGDDRADKVIARLMIQDGLAYNEDSAKALMNEKGEIWLADYLRKVPAYEIYHPDASTASGSTKESGVLASGIYEDGYVIPDNVFNIMKNGGYKKVPVMLGCLSEELKLFLMMLGVETHKLHGLIKTHNPDRPNLEFEDAFPIIFKPVYRTLTSAGQIVFQGFGVDIASNILSGQQNSVYTYKITWNNGSAPFDYLLGASHALDVPLLFGNFLPPGKSLIGCAWGGTNKTERDSLSHIIMTYWSSFARFGNPNTGNTLPLWQPWSNDYGGRQRMVFDAGTPYLSDSLIETDLPDDPEKAVEDMILMLEGFAQGNTD